LFLVLSDLFHKFECGSPITIDNKMKVSPKQTQSRWKTGFLHAFLAIFLMGTMACDFDIPDKFEMPTWYLDLKIPLVQTRYEMSDISDSSAGIFLTDDSLGFKIIQEGEMPATELPDLPSVAINLDQQISSGEISGISMDIELPEIIISQRINVVAYDTLIYLDTTDYYIDTTVTLLDTTVFPPEPYDTTILIKIAEGYFLQMILSDLKLSKKGICQPPNSQIYLPFLWGLIKRLHLERFLGLAWI